MQGQGLLLHGSGNAAVTALEPRPQTTFFGRPARGVFATSDAIWATFFAIVDRSRSAGLRNGCFPVTWPGGTVRGFRPGEPSPLFWARQLLPRR